MQLEWTRWLEGMTAFKEGQGMLWIFIVVLFAVLWHRRTLVRSRLLLASAVFGFLIVVPLSAVVLLKGFTPFYDWMDLQQLLPLNLLNALFCMLLIELLQKNLIPDMMFRDTWKKVVSLGCVVVLLLTATNFHGFDYRASADEHGVPLETAEALDAVYVLVGDTPVVIAAKGDMLQYVRMYEPAWQPLYGRDLWSGKSASYINSGYDVEYEYYTLLEQAELDDGDQADFLELLSRKDADLVIVPYYWREAYSQIPEYELIVLTDRYNVIIKKDLIAE